jgi:ornithine cyclodeaminase
MIPAADVHAALAWRPLVDALRAAFVAGATAPGAVEPRGHAGRRPLLLMPAWDGAGLGVKIVTVFPRNHERGIASVARSTC